MATSKKRSNNEKSNPGENTFRHIGQKIRFDDLCNLLLSLGFTERIMGDHHIFTKPDLVEIINLQPLGDGKAKPYQVKQARTIIVNYKLAAEK